jgi:hypothetical protein
MRTGIGRTAPDSVEDEICVDALAGVAWMAPQAVVGKAMAKATYAWRKMRTLFMLP